MIYLDNAATSYPKPNIVNDEIYKFMKNNCGNPGRGGYKMAIISSQEVMKTRQQIAEFFNIRNPLRVCFTKNATEALNIAIKGVLKAGDHVVTTSMEHNSVLRPLHTLESSHGIELSIVNADSYGNIHLEDVKKLLRSNTRLVVCTLSSNVNGTILPFDHIGELLDHKKTLYLVDASQGAGAMKVDVQASNIDMLAFPGHKSLLGPQGIGGLYVRDDIIIKPTIQGGTGSNSKSLYQPEYFPDQLESGTLNTPGIVGLRYGIEFINNTSINNITIYKYLLLKRLYDGLSSIKGIKLYSNLEKNSGIVSFNIEGQDPVTLSEILDKEFDIASRAGFHCAPLAHKTLGTYSEGTVRLSLGCFNTLEEMDYTIDAIERIAYYSKI